MIKISADNLKYVRFSTPRIPFQYKIKLQPSVDCFRNFLGSQKYSAGCA